MLLAASVLPVPWQPLLGSEEQGVLKLSKKYEFITAAGAVTYDLMVAREDCVPGAADPARPQSLLPWGPRSVLGTPLSPGDTAQSWGHCSVPSSSAAAMRWALPGPPAMPRTQQAAPREKSGLKMSCKQ